MIQQYFKTGKTIVIDDQYDEAKPLLDALSRIHIPFIYTEGKPSANFPLPNSSKEDAQYYNLVFLDLNLDFKFSGGGLSENDEKTFKSTHANLFETLIKNVNRSFIIVIWSNEEENYKNSFLKIFDDNEKYRTDKKPYKIISLSKPDYFTKGDENYKFKSGKEDDLKEKINKELSDLEAFKLFCEWDGITSAAAGDSVDDFMGLINHINEEDKREEHLAKALTCLAIAYSGEDRYLSVENDSDKTNAVLYTLSQMLVNDLDKNIYSGICSDFKNWTEISEKKKIKTLKEEIKYSLFNRKLLQFRTQKEYLINSVYFSGSSVNHNNIFDDIYNSTSKKTKKCALDVYKSENGGQEPPNIDVFNGNLNNYVIRRVSEIEVDITPACDIANMKAPLHRLILGFAIPRSLELCFDSSLDFIFKSPVFEIDKTMINEVTEEYFLVFDFRYLITKAKRDIRLKNYLFSLRSNLVNDIQIKLGSHVARLGTFNL